MCVRVDNSSLGGGEAYRTLSENSAMVVALLGGEGRGGKGGGTIQEEDARHSWILFGGTRTDKEGSTYSTGAPSFWQKWSDPASWRRWVCSCWGQKQNITAGASMFGIQGHHWGPFIHMYIMMNENKSHAEIKSDIKKF